MKQQFIKDASGVFQTRFYKDNRRICPGSASFTAYKPGSSEKLVDGAPMAVDADGTVSYGLSAADNSIAGCDYKAVVSYVYDSAVFYATLFYDVVVSRLAKTVTDDDVVAELPQLKENGWKARGQAEGGSATTIVDSELKRYEDGYFTGGLAYSMDKDETRAITGFTSSTGAVATEAFSSAISTDRYVLTRSYTGEIQRAFEKLEERLRRAGKRPQLVLDPDDLREAHIYASVAEVCKGMITESDGLWWRLWKEYEAKAEETFGAMNFKYDETGDGFIGGAEAAAKADSQRAVRR
ncbi:MAG: hypothetical protein HY894_07900 [Deltaproteobacteria bacterium]|nr:hypothetical protein [Deltaproteobacteria bacterium]